MFAPRKRSAKAMQSKVRTVFNDDACDGPAEPACLIDEAHIQTGHKSEPGFRKGIHDETVVNIQSVKIGSLGGMNPFLAPEVRIHKSQFSHRLD
jgi:hypothetical protein